MSMPEHLKRYAIEKILKVLCKLPSQYHLPPSMLRKSMRLATRNMPIHQDVEINEITLAGLFTQRHAIRTIPPSEKAILHVHGGAFFLGSPHTHRGLASQLAGQIGATVYVLDYPLSPEHVYPSAINSIKAAYMELIQQGYDAKNIIFSGDSCGGNLALAAVLALRDENIVLPSCLILMSPFLDLTLSGESMQMNKKLDAMLSQELLQQGSRYYVGENFSLDNPLVSPLFAELSGLPPTLVQVGSKEVLLDDANRFKALAEAANNSVELSIYPGMWHVFQMFSPWIDMAEQSILEIRDFIQRQT
ncbi:MAG: alpha/beta hydrolase [Pedobacter sp.]|nr:MAG: alpha/beta hydrolase [Pedobacter sp.]